MERVQTTWYQYYLIGLTLSKLWQHTRPTAIGSSLHFYLLSFPSAILKRAIKDASFLFTSEPRQGVRVSLGPSCVFRYFYLRGQKEWQGKRKSCWGKETSNGDDIICKNTKKSLISLTNYLYVYVKKGNKTAFKNHMCVHVNTVYNNIQTVAKWMDFLLDH